MVNITRMLNGGLVVKKMLNGNWYSFDPVTKMYAGWWMTGKYSKFRPEIEKEYNHYMKLPKITTMKQADELFNSSSSLNLTWQKRFHGRLLYTFSPELRDTPEILEKAIISNYGWGICLMSDRIQKDPYMVKMVLRDNPTNLYSIRKHHLGDIDLMKIVVENPKRGWVIRDTPDETRNNHFLAKIGIKNGISISEFGEEIKNNESFLKLAMKNDYDEWKLASNRLKDKYNNIFKRISVNAENFIF